MCVYVCVYARAHFNEIIWQSYKLLGYENINIYLLFILKILPESRPVLEASQ